MTLTELYDKLAAHDWYYAMSDDYSVYLAGTREEERLVALARTIEGGEALMEAFARHYFSGEPWGTEQAPKPPRPESA